MIQRRKIIQFPDTPSSYSGYAGKYARVNTGETGLEFSTVSGGSAVEGATLVVAASDSKDTSRADYVCDGTSDETEINQALTALPTVGGTVVLLEGTYVIDGSISMTSKDSLTGNGHATEIKIDDTVDANLNMIDIATGNSDIVISNLRLNGNRSQQSAGTQYGISMTGTVEHCKIIGCYFEHVRTRAIHVNNTPKFNLISGNHFDDNTVDIGLEYADNNIISNNILYGCVWVSMYMNYAASNNISCNYFDKIYQHAIETDGDSNHNLISCNYFTGCSQESNDLYQTVRMNSGSYNTISGNVFRKGSYTNKPEYGLKMASGADYNMVHGNNFYDSGVTGDINDTAIGTRKRDNIANDGTWMTDV